MYIHQHIREKHTLGSSTRVCVVRANETDERGWLREAPVCGQLSQHRIAHCGIMHAAHPLEIVRIDLSGTFFLACFEGEGQVLIDGAWQSIAPGMACLQPPFIPNALKTKRRKRWNFCWVRYEEMPDTRPIVSADSPVFGRFESAALHAALTGLHAEASSTLAPAALQHWTELVHGYVLSFAQPFRGDDRLQNVWDAVQGQLDRAWTLAGLAKIACVSKEHLRRLASRSLGRTPMQHVTFLRMRRAAELLETTDKKISQIARKVGYANPYAFSDTFQRWVGLRPSDSRKRSRPHFLDIDGGHCWLDAGEDSDARGAALRPGDQSVPETERSTQTISLSLRANTQRWANAGCDQTTLRRPACKVGSISGARLCCL